MKQRKRRQQRAAEKQTAAIALCATAVWSGAHAATPPLPVTCAAAACGRTGPTTWLSPGLPANAATLSQTANSLTINQAVNTAIYNWSSFNIAAGNSVTFQQPSSSSVALNRIYQASPSQIFGALNANGQVFLLNQNGFLFGAGSTINVGSLLASSLPLNLTDADILNGSGILSPLKKSQAAFDLTKDTLVPGGRTVVVDSEGSPVLDTQGNPIPVQILVQPGAQINAAVQGRVLFAGQQVSNGGSISAPDGQIVLAAGSKVYLQASADPNLRGLIVEVTKLDTDDKAANTAWNQLTGALSAPRGNVTMVGLAVNQEGRISATTSVSANGSIRLEAAVVNGNPSTDKLASNTGGKLTVGTQSEMDILPELSSTETAVVADKQPVSSVTLLGEQVFVKGGSITAPGGSLKAIAASDPSAASLEQTSLGSPDPNARLRIDPGVSIDLSGSKATLPVTANLMAVQLRSAELADDPAQRDGPLHQQTVYVDARIAKSSTFANFAGDVDALPMSIAQRTEQGGTATFLSSGDLVFSSGAKVNVSGGSTTYTPGVMQTSYLIGANGKLYPIQSADPLMSYVGVLNPTFSQTYNKWGVKDVLPTPGLSSYQSGYVQGAAAGQVQFVAPSMVLQGALQGNAVSGLYQRTPATAVSGGHLIIGLQNGIASTANPLAVDYISPAVQFTRNPVPIVASDDSPLPNPLTLFLPTSYLTDTGFTYTQINSNYDVTLPAGASLSLPAGSTFSVNAARVNILAGITDPGGTLSFQNVYDLGSLSTTSARPGVFIGDDVKFDVSGLWTNDMPLVGGSGVAPTWQDGGTINLSVTSPGSMLSVGNDVSLLANGGAWLNAKGSITGGKGGSITLASSDTVSAISGIEVGSGLSLAGYGVQGAKGGTFNLTAPRLEIANGSGAWTEAQQIDETITPGGVFKLYSSLFSDYGFQNFGLNASGLVVPDAANTNLLTVDAGTSINAIVSTQYLSSQAYRTRSGTAMSNLATLRTPPAYLRKAASISLSALPPASVQNPTQQLGSTPAGDVVIEKGAVISTDAGGTITLASLDSVLMDGTLRAPGGKVSFHLVGPRSDAYQTFESGFLPNQRIDLGPDATIDVAGTFAAQPTILPLNLGTLYAGGTVSMLADRGTVVAERGSLISVAGFTAPQDVLQSSGTYGHQLASSAGGSITARSGESIFLNGTIQAAGGGGGTSGAAAGGSLEVDLTRSETWWQINGGPEFQNSFNQAPLNVQLSSQQPVIVGSPIPLFNSNQAVLGATDLSQWGLDALRIQAGNSITLEGNVSLGLNRSIVIDAPVISTTAGAQASLSAPYMEVGYVLTTGTAVNNNIATGGTGSVRFSGSEIDLVGTTVFQGTSAVSFSSSGDMLLRGPATNVLTGGVAVAGNLTVDAARIYPVTGTSFTFDAQRLPDDTGGVLTIGQTSANPGTPLSAGGALTLKGYDVVDNGTLYAPFGRITFDAANSLMLGDGSFTSVSGNGLTIPYGQTQFNGGQWIYADPNQTLAGIPTRAVNLNGPTVNIAAGATIDLTGGGELFAYEFAPGAGGTRDQLAPNATTLPGTISGLYAILPSTRGQAAPQDPLYAGSETIQAGQSVYLSGGAGLQAGFYPLLPARYGLVPGAYLIKVESGMVSTTPGSMGTLQDGAPVVAGYLSYGSTGLHQTPGYTGIAIYPGSYGGKLAQYDVSLASTFYSEAATLAGKSRPNLPVDAGLLSINVGSILNAAGVVRTAAATGGVAATIEVSARDLVVGSASGPVPDDAVSIDGSVLSSWHPGSLVLGGKTSASDDGASIAVLANSVILGAGTDLTADQIVVVANQSVDVQSGARLQTTSAANGSAPAKAPAAESVALTDASGTATGAGLLALSDLNYLIPTTGSSGGAATVGVESGSTLASRGSLSVNGPGKITLDGSLGVSGAEVSLSASSIAFVPQGVQADALAIGAPLLGQLGTASDVRLASSGAIDLMTPITLGVDANGNPTLKSLTIVAQSLNNQAPAGSSATQLGARTLVLQGVGTDVAVASAGPAGTTLSLTANELDIGPNSFTVTGFAATQAKVSGAVIGKGTGLLNVGGDLTIAASGVTVDAAADTSIAAGGSLIVGNSGGNGAGVPVLLGGALSLTGNSVDISGRVTAPSGIIKVTSGAGGVSIDSGATISTAGRIVGIENQSVSTPGGDILVNAGSGNLTLGSGATLDVSGAGSAAAGTLGLIAGGSASIAATLKGAGGTGAAGGNFSLDAGSLPSASGGNPLASLANALTSGGFTNSIDVRARTGDLSLEAGSSLSANSVALTTDSGFLSVGGEISAPSGDMRGSISLFGGQGVALLSGAALHADGTGPSGRGGTIEIGAGKLVADATGVLNSYNDAVIRLDQGSTISAAGNASKGTLLLRAPALLASNDVAIGGIGSDISGLGAVVIEPVLPFNIDSTSVPTTAPQSVIDYIAAARGNIAAKMPTGSAVPLLVEAGVELISSGTGPLVLPALDLSAWNTAIGAPVDLSVRAAGDLQVTGNISDGFSTATGQLTLTSGLSSSIRLVAGADLSSADPLAAVNGTGKLTLGPGAVVRTGTGDIDLVAGQNIEVGNGAQAYTAGVPAIAPGGDASNPYPLDPKYGTPNADNSGILVAGTNLLMSFPMNGGNLRVHAGNDIVGSSLTTMSSAPGAGPSVSDWELREGSNISLQALPMWGINLQSYDWNFGTLGGGDVHVAAGHDASNLTVAAADSLLPQYSGTTQYVSSGGLSLSAGHDIGSAQVFLADGHGTVRAGGALTSILQDPTNSTLPNIGSAFYLQNSSLSVTARVGITVDGVFNPTSLGQSLVGTNRPAGGNYFSYSDDAALSLQSINGDIELGKSSRATVALLGISTVNRTKADSFALAPSLTAQALGGDIRFDVGIGNAGIVWLAPSPKGQLDLVASGDIVSANGGGVIRMSDAKPGTYSSLASPFGTSVVAVAFSGDLHQADSAPAQITAGGNIDKLKLSIPKAAQVVAGNDINLLTLFGQNLNDTDITVVAAGRDITYPQNAESQGISVGGPGELQVLAGRNISLGNAEGIATSGNLLNPNLPTAQGANLTVVTGLGTAPDFTGFLAAIIAPSPTYQSELIDYVEMLQPKLSGLSFADAKTAFQQLTPEQQRPLIDKVFFHELLLSGRAGGSDPNAGFKQGYAAIDALFPGSRTDSTGVVDGAYAGDLTLTSSKIYTLSGGDINIVVPGGFKSQPPAGLVDVGLANPPPILGAKDPSRLGIVTEGPGNVNIYSKKDVNVNASRVFTLGGGNILIWSDEGNIDAGRGAKAAISAPPPTILIADDGSVQQNFAGAVAGSGIRTIQTNPKQSKGSVDLIAPSGVIDAGDAGIGAAGDINLAARDVIGANNISFGGSARGVPAEVSNLGASLSSASSAGSGATANAANAAEAAQRAAEQASNAPLSQTALSWLDVFVTGLGEENCKPDDLDCMKRQKTNVN